MQNILSVMASKCTSLRKLTLRKVGQRDQFDYPFLWMEILDKDVYVEWAFFISSMKEALQTLVFDQGERYRPWTADAQPGVRPMDRRFEEWVFPVLVGDGEDGWEKLKRVEVRGVQVWDGSWGAVNPVTLQPASVYVSVEGDLKRKLGERVRVEVRKRAREADHGGVVNTSVLHR